MKVNVKVVIVLKKIVILTNTDVGTDRNLKWHYAQFSLPKLAFNCYIIQKIATYNNK